MDAAVTPLLAALGDPVGSVLVRTVSMSGFGLRDSGDGAIITDGSFEGRVLGGMADDELVAHAMTPEARHVERVTITDKRADAAGMVCGGAAHYLFTPVADLPPGLALHLAQAAPVAIVARADGGGADLVVTPKRVEGSLASDPASHDITSEAIDQALVEIARSLLAKGSTASEVHGHDGVDYLVSAIVPATRLRVVGSGAMAEAIAAQGALLGWTCSINESVPDGEAFIAEAGPADAIAILSHDADVDVPLLHAALSSAIGYIGGMGSRGTQTRRHSALRAAGWTEQDLARVHGPIGLDLGSRTPAETAVAIAAEFLANRSGRAPGRLTDSAGPING